MTRTLKLYGPPGTGKTTFLLKLLEQEMKKVEPQRIGFLTFTRSARIEALERSRLSDEGFPYCRTIHAICYRQLHVQRHQVLKPRMIQNWGKEIGLELTGKAPDPLEEDQFGDQAQTTIGDRLLALNHLGRHRGVGLKAMLETAQDPELGFELSRWFTEAYRVWKRKEGLYDYTDFLTEYLRRGRPLDVSCLFVDEAQDLSWLQWNVIETLGRDAQRTYLAGDDDQAIFTWAGASARLFNQRPAHEIRVLDQSYRCPRQVMDLANRMIGEVKARMPKLVLPRAEEGLVDDVGSLTDDLLTDARTFVLYRHHHRGRVLAKELEDQAVPWLGHGSPLGEPRYHQALTCWHRWIKGERSSPAETQALLSMADPTYLRVRDAEGGLTGPEAVVGFRANLAFQVMRNLPKRWHIERCVELRGWEETLRPRVTLQSIHQAKGQEADTVILDHELTRRSWESLMREPDDEHRVFYVGVTRARHRLIRLMPSTSLSYPL